MQQRVLLFYYSQVDKLNSSLNSEISKISENARVPVFQDSKNGTQHNEINSVDVRDDLDASNAKKRLQDSKIPNVSICELCG